MSAFKRGFYFHNEWCGLVVHSRKKEATLCRGDCCERHHSISVENG